MRPLIGITCDSGDAEESTSSLSNAYALRIWEAGGLPLLIPILPQTVYAAELVSKLDGLLLTGGGDPAPILMGEEPQPGNGRVTWHRDTLEFALLKLFLASDKPILGICRGCQMLNVAAGGSIWQDAALRPEATLQHRQTHDHRFPAHSVQVNPESRFARHIPPPYPQPGGGSSDHLLMVNSSHHQFLKEIAPGYAAGATAPDRVVEAVEDASHVFRIGVQWHPEKMEDPLQHRLFAAFVTAAGRQR